MGAKVLQGVVVVVAVGLFFEIARRNANRAPLRDPETGDLILQFGPVLVWTMAAIAVIGPVGMLVLSFVIPFRNEREVFVPFGLGLFFLLLGGGLWLYLSRRRTRVSSTGLTSEYVFAAPRHMAWEDVERLKFANNQELLLYDQGGRKASLHLWQVGTKEAIPLLRAHLPAAVQEAHKGVLERFFAAAGG